MPGESPATRIDSAENRTGFRWLETVDEAFEVMLAAVEAGKSTRFSLGKRGFALIRGGVLCLERKRGAIPRRVTIACVDSCTE